MAIHTAFKENVKATILLERLYNLVPIKMVDVALLFHFCKGKN